MFSSDFDDDLDLDELFEDVKLPEDNMYISNDDNAVSLISELIRNKTNNSFQIKRKIESYIDDIFTLFSDVSIENELDYYEQFMDLCARLSERGKIQKIQDKAVISFGGKFSAGKSKFINSISGIGELLPVNQAPTTSIPTYIIKSSCEKLSANSIYGYSVEITTEAMNALTHEFYDVYGIGFSAFVDSIIAESVDYSLSEKIALLDTPGYTKFDDESDSKLVISDRQKAYEQLRASDYLIWLVDIENGGLTKDDVEFMESLHMKTPILIVFTKADLKTEEIIQEVIKGAKKTLEETSIKCFGVTAYSSNLNIEYGDSMIEKFISFAENDKVRNNDVANEFKKTQDAMRNSIMKSIIETNATAKRLFDYVKNSSQIMEIRSLAVLWGKANQDHYLLTKLLRKYDRIVESMNHEIRYYIGKAE